MGERGQTDERRRAALLGFALGTFAVVMLVLGTIGVTHARGALGDLLGGLNAIVGLSIFGVLWGLSVWSGTVAVRPLTLDPPPSWSRVVLRAARAGGIVGAAVAGGGVLVGVALVILTNDGAATLVESLAVLLLYGAAAAGVAFVIGASVGVLLGTLARALLAAALHVERGPTRATHYHSPQRR